MSNKIFKSVISTLKQLKGISDKRLGDNPIKHAPAGNFQEKNTDNILISVVIPVYNVEKYLRQCLDSVINQTYSNIEIICIDDAAERNSVKILQDYALKDSRVKLLHVSPNIGLGRARNLGALSASGEYIHFLDADDWIKANLYEEMKNIIDEFHPQMINFSFQKYNNKKKSFEYEYVYKENYLFNKIFSGTDYPEFINNNEAVWKCLYKREFLQKNKLFFSDLPCHEDTAFYMECILKAKAIYILPEVLYFYRTNRAKSLMKDRFKYYDCYPEWIKTLEKLASEYDENIRGIILKRIEPASLSTYNYFIQNDAIGAAKYYNWVKNFIKEKGVNTLPKELIPYAETMLKRTYPVYAARVLIKYYCPHLVNILVKIKKSLQKQT